MLKRATSALAAAALLFTAVPALAEDESSAATTTATATGASALSSVPQRIRRSWDNLPQTLSRSWQCVTFARHFSGIQIFGDAWTWWGSAEGRYARGHTPEHNAVLVFRKTGRMRYGHVAVVSNVLTDRVVQLTHANWSPINGRRGQVEEDVVAVDVSPANDWSEVKVWYGPSENLGGSVNPAYGFVYAQAERPDGIGATLASFVGR